MAGAVSFVWSSVCEDAPFQQTTMTLGGLPSAEGLEAKWRPVVGPRGPLVADAGVWPWHHATVCRRFMIDKHALRVRDKVLNNSAVSANSHCEGLPAETEPAQERLTLSSPTLGHRPGPLAFMAVGGGGV